MREVTVSVNRLGLRVCRVLGFNSKYDHPFYGGSLGCALRGSACFCSALRLQGSAGLCEVWHSAAKTVNPALLSKT